MLCPFCQHPESQVIDTRPSLYNQIPGIRRRRLCRQCNKRFSSFEMTINDLEGVEPATLDGLLQQIIKVFKDAPRTNYKTPDGPLALVKALVDDKTPTIPLKSPANLAPAVTLNGKVTSKDIQEAMRRARQRLAQQLDDLDASEFDDSDFD